MLQTYIHNTYVEKSTPINLQIYINIYIYMQNCKVISKFKKTPLKLTEISYLIVAQL